MRWEKPGKIMLMKINFKKTKVMRFAEMEANEKEVIQSTSSAEQVNQALY